MKKTKMAALGLAVVLTLSIFTLTGFSFPEGAEHARESKITEELRLRLEDAGEEEMIPIHIWLSDIDHDAVKEKAYRKTGISESSLVLELTDEERGIISGLSDTLVGSVSGAADINIEEQGAEEETWGQYALEDTDSEILRGLDSGISEEQKETFARYLEATRERREKLSADIDTYNAAERAFYAEAYDALNNSFAEKYLGKGKMLYACSLTPMIICELPKRDIEKLEKMDSVTSLSLYDDTKFSDLGGLSISMPSIGAYTARNVLNLTGSGVVIGMVETEMPYTGVPELSAASITRRAASPLGGHPSMVAAIMVGTNGAAPAAGLKCATATDEQSFYDAVRWLVVTGNINVLNVSWGGYGDGTYTNIAKWVDAVTYSHKVTFVVSSGNDGVDMDYNPNIYVNKVGNAYNAIMVGGIDDKDTLNKDDDTMYSASSWRTRTGMPNKPDVVAPAVNFSINLGSSGSYGPSNGTSWASPHVTGVLAQLMQAWPVLKRNPMQARSTILASCNRKVPGETFGSLTNKQGAGVIDATNGFFLYEMTAGTAGQEFLGIIQPNTRKKIGTIQLTAGNVFIGVLTWYKMNTINLTPSLQTTVSSEPPLSRLVLEFRNTATQETWFSDTPTGNNVQYSFTRVTKTGTYDVYVQNYANVSEEYSFSFHRY